MKTAKKDNDMIELISSYSFLPKEKQQGLKPLLKEAVKRHKELTGRFKIANDFSTKQNEVSVSTQLGVNDCIYNIKEDSKKLN